MEEKLIELAERFAELKGTEVLASRFLETEKLLVFVLGSGHKLKMNERELRDEIARLEPKPMRTKPVPTDEEKPGKVVKARKRDSDLAST